jgi:hypothetical protein
MEPNEFNLKVWEIIISALTPVAIVWAGYFIKKSLSARENELVALRRLQDIRKSIYDEIGPKLNQIFCYIFDVGDYGSYEPMDIIQLKREVDRKFCTYRELWHKETIGAYKAFMAAAFETYVGVGTPAKIRTMTHEKKTFFSNFGKQWGVGWDEKFSEKKDPEVQSLYETLIQRFIEDMTRHKSV